MMKMYMLLASCGLAAQLIPAQITFATTRVWKAQWIDAPGTSPQDYGVYHFRRTFDLAARPEHFEVFVSGDNRYQLYVNGTRMSWGPARGDLTHWRYERVDIAPKLRQGKNVLAAVVWNDGPNRAVAQITNQTGFVLEAEDAAHVAVNTSRDWKAAVDPAYSQLPYTPEQITYYYALAANEKLDASKYPWDWEQPGFDDSQWASADEISPAAARDARDSSDRWMLVRSEIPLEEQHPERALRVRKSEGVSVPPGFPAQQWTVPPNTSATVLLDQTYLTTAYPELTFSGGRGGYVSIAYAETLYISKEPINKGNRNVIEGRKFLGPQDVYISDGGSHRTYRPLYWRTYRYIQLHVETKNEALAIEKLGGMFTGYPFEKKARFEMEGSPDNTKIQEILATGWHTARLCAHETYMDCPYYEQLQYAGDARIQMMVSLYMTGDARLMKNGIGLINSSRTAEGATYSREPSYLEQYIPPFSLWWIGMVRDYWMFVDDPQYVKSMLPGVRAVLDFYAGYQKKNGSLARMPWWNYVDWVKQWPNGEPPADPDGSSAAALDLQLLLAYQWGADLERALGKKSLGDEDAAAAAQLKETVLGADWDAARGLFADQPAHTTYSQQVNTLAVLAHAVEGQQARAVVEKMISDPSLAQSSIYFRAYTNASLREVGLGAKYLEMLGPWREMLRQGLTTWAEVNQPDTRSDCHAWGSSPNFELLRTVAGIDSSAPGFQRVRIAPNLGTLKHVLASMPHPAGTIRVDLHQDGNNLRGEVVLPDKVAGTFEWGSQAHELHGGTNSIAF